MKSGFFIYNYHNENNGPDAHSEPSATDDLYGTNAANVGLTSGLSAGSILAAYRRRVANKVGWCF
jgi:hypothetical protein